jgi:hypothetical protein
VTVASGKNLTPGRYYRITKIDPGDPNPSLRVGDVVLCAAATAGCIDPEQHISDGMGTEWFADYDIAEGSFGTLINGVEEAEQPS